MKITKYRIAISRPSVSADSKIEAIDDHGHLFEALKKHQIRIESTDKHRLQFVAFGQIILAESPVEMVGIPNVKIETEINQGDVVKMSVILSRVQRVYQKNLSTGRVYPTFVSLSKQDERISFYKNILIKNGFDVSQINVYKDDDRFIVKDGAEKAIPCSEVVFTAKIANLNKVVKALNCGIGREKTYGLGMLRFLDE